MAATIIVAVWLALAIAGGYWLIAWLGWSD
jgi:hypothetical protein